LHDDYCIIIVSIFWKEYKEDKKCSYNKKKDACLQRRL